MALVCVKFRPTSKGIFVAFRNVKFCIISQPWHLNIDYLLLTS